MQKREKVTKDEIMNAIPQSRGQLEPIERLLNCTRQALRDCIAEHPELKQELDDEMERTKDRIIMAMMDDAIDGEPKERGRARELLMKAIARDRGFGDKVEVTGANGSPMVVLHTNPQALAMDVWARNAQNYALRENDAIDAKISEVLDGNQGNKRLGK